MQCSHFSEWNQWTVFPVIFQIGYLSRTWMRQLLTAIMNIMLDRCGSTIICILVLPTCRWHCYILPCLSDPILTLQTFSTFCLLQINRGIHAEAICHVYSIIRMSHLSTPFHSMYIIWEKCMNAECGEISNSHSWEMHQYLSNLPNLECYATNQLMRTGDPMLVDWASEMNTIYF